MRRRLIITGVVILLLAGLGTVLWKVLNQPPLRRVLRYGYPSPMGPTGRTATIEGVEFVEISPGHFLMGSHLGCEKGNLLGRVRRRTHR